MVGMKETFVLLVLKDVKVKVKVKFTLEQATKAQKGSRGITPLFLDFKLSPCFEYIMFLLGSSPASELCVPTFRNTLSVPSS